MQQERTSGAKSPHLTGPLRPDLRGCGKVSVEENPLPHLAAVMDGLKAVPFKEFGFFRSL
jgi:hypothetical protein